ncbi:hypothetical protein LTR62_002132 [Meristemomyces frigidus]|uniref:Large ribosomal subunit protein mL54 n=1 Tax=Meristemomyces frigidus TaxID=1508187 RepID=A0AAN7T7P6_9PEZI|nr:hypothetical protein LTR62_002132 [Meristemomyces frigidus]
MICRRCLQRLARRQVPTSTHRTFTTTTRNQDHPSNPSLPPNDIPARTPSASKPAALSTPAVAQPFSTPLTPSPDGPRDTPLVKATKPAASIAKSSVPAGTVLKGLNFLKNKADPVAGEDGEYPAWLWGVLERTEGQGGTGGAEAEGDLFAKSKKQRQRAAKALRKQQALHPESLAPKVPLYEQTTDLPAGDGTVEGAMAAGEAREELNSSMRGMRRRKIKEDNFLRSMG